MALFKKNSIMNVIRCDEPSYLIWKWRPEGSELGVNKGENTIRWGSSLRVKEGSVAVFVYSQPNGFAQEYIEGPFDAIIETSNLPVIASLVGLAYGGDSPFQAEVYFINLAGLIQVKFGVPYFDVFDPRFLDYGVPTAIRGSINFRITDYKEFIRLHRLDHFSMDDFKLQVRDAVIRYVKGVVSNAPADNGLPVLQIERKINEINDLVEASIKNRFYNEFGVTVSSIDISTIEVDKGSSGYKELQKVLQEISTKTIQAKADVDIKEMRDSQKLGVFKRAAQAFVDVKEGAYERHKKTQTTNYAAYQTEAAENVGVAAAEGLGQMGSGSSGGSVGGINPTAMMAGMAIGSAMGQNLAGAINNSMPIINGAAPVPQAPPPIPSPTYHVAVNGSAAGPYDLESLTQMALSGKISKDSLVWKPGMEAWLKMSEVSELSSVLMNIMPPIPSAPSAEDK